MINSEKENEVRRVGNEEEAEEEITRLVYNEDCDIRNKFVIRMSEALVSLLAII